MKEPPFSSLSGGNQYDIHPKPLMRRLMIPLSLLILFSFTAALVFVYQQHRHSLDQAFGNDIAELNRSMETLLSENSSALFLAIQPIASDQRVHKALKEGDSRALLMQWNSVFEEMKKESGVTHLYFMDAHRVCLLRVHNPAKKGDVIDRFTAMEAEWNHRYSSGIEIGPMGNLTLRVVQPVIVESEVIGYIEMGKEIEEIFNKLHYQSNTHVAVLLKKQYLERSAWEEGMRLLSREEDWDLLSDTVLSYTSFSKIPKNIIEILQQDVTFDHLHEQADKEVSTEGNTYRLSLLSIKDVSGKEVGDIVIFNNITNANLAFLDTLLMGGIISLALAGGMIGLVYLLIYRTDRGIKNQQHNLYESQHRFEQIARHSRTYAWEVDEKGRYTYVSDVVFDVLGYQNEEMIGKYFYDFHPKSGKDEFIEEAFKVFEHKASFSNLKNSAMSKEGNIVWLMTNAMAILAADGRLLGYRGSDTDITEWQKAEDTILESRNLLTTIIDTIPIRVFWKSPTLRYLGCNTLFAKDAGLETPGDLIGKDDYQMGWRAQADFYREDDRRVIHSGEAKLFYEEEQTTPSGERIWLSTSKVPLKNSEGEILGLLGVYEDITQQKEMQYNLSLNAKMLNEAQHFARMGSWSLDLKANTLAWSDEVYHIFEIDAERFSANYDNFLERIHPDDRELVNHAYLSSLDNKQPYEITHRLLMENGTIKWVHETGMSDFDEEGQPIRSMGTVQDISNQKMAEDEINRLAYFDSLTQLPNRTLLIDRLNQAMVLSSRNLQYGALMFIDLDNFKTLNDTLGHGMGDSLLKQTSLRLLQSLREGDSVARFGGDEFIVLLTGLGDDLKHAATACEMIGEKILGSLDIPYDLGEISYHSTASIGITLFLGSDVNDDELMKQADLAMYKAKDGGKNSLSFFDPDMESSLRERSTLEEDIRAGIETEQFLLYYQPQVNDGGRVVGAEALIRWQHPLRGLVSPAEFIPMAEETGLIVPLGEWVLKKACAQITLWEKEAPFSSLILAVNVSARQFNQKEFVDGLKSILEETQANPQRLKLELTETLLVQNVEEVIEKMEQLRGLGITFALDDFGTGYSSLSYLKRLPIDQLKIDQSFVRDIMSNSNDAIICKSTIALSESMGLYVIAEGVETPEQLAALRGYGCHHYQGYWFSRPLEIEQFEAYADEQNSHQLGEEKK